MNSSSGSKPNHQQVLLQNTLEVDLDPLARPVFAIVSNLDPRLKDREIPEARPGPVASGSPVDPGHHLPEWERQLDLQLSFNPRWCGLSQDSRHRHRRENRRGLHESPQPSIYHRNEASSRQNRFLTRLVLIAPALLALLAISTRPGHASDTSGSPSGREERELTIGEAPRIVIKHVRGNLTVRGVDSPSISVLATKRTGGVIGARARKLRSRVDVRVSGKLGRASVETVYSGEADWGTLKKLQRAGDLADLDVDLQISLPRKSYLEVNTVAGSLTVSRMDGPVSINGDTADIRATRIRGACRIVASGGAVHLDDIRGSLSVRTVLGPVDGRGVRGSCVLDTVSGGVQIGIVPDHEAVIRINSMSGPVQVFVDDRADLSYRLESESGTVTSDFSSGRRNDGEALKGRIGRGGGDLRVKTLSSPVRLTRKRAPVRRQSGRR